MFNLSVTGEINGKEITLSPGDVCTIDFRIGNKLHSGEYRYKTKTGCYLGVINKNERAEWIDYDFIEDIKNIKKREMK